MFGMVRSVVLVAAIAAMCVVSGCRAKPNRAPMGYTALFNGKDLAGWQGLVESPPVRAKMTPEEFARAQGLADQRMRDHWRVVDGALVFDGGGDSLCTIEQFGDFDLYVDWKIPKDGDSGIYLRGSPQVQIWDSVIGSGGLYNNQKNPSRPLVVADKPVGEWNTFRVRMIGERVTVWLNRKKVVNDTVLENYWERDKPIYRVGAIELQNHGNTLYFRNIYVKRLKR
jgi:hypothetical protein